MGYGYNTTLPLEVFPQRNFVADFEIEFYSKQQKSLYNHPLGGLRGDVHTQSIARWKASGRLPIRHN